MEPKFICVGENESKRDIAMRVREGKTPGIVWLGGYRSDMIGTKAEALDQWAAENGHACCRFDYSGHGESGGEFRDGTISRWLEESLTVFDASCVEGSHVLVGSSMGGWIALRMVQELFKRGQSSRVKGLVMIAPAADFTHELTRHKFTEDQWDTIQREGVLEVPSQYSDEPYVFTKALFDDGEENRVMTGPIETGCPVHILQGMQDPDVPYEHAMKLVSFLPDEAVTMTLIKEGDHRLSREEDIVLLLRTTATMLTS